MSRVLYGVNAEDCCYVLQWELIKQDGSENIRVTRLINCGATAYNYNPVSVQGWLYIAAARCRLLTMSCPERPRKPLEL